MPADAVTKLSSSKTLSTARRKAADPVALPSIVTEGNPHEVWGSSQKGKKAKVLFRSTDQNAAQLYALRWFSDRIRDRTSHVTVEVRHQPAGVVPEQVTAAMAYVRE